MSEEQVKDFLELMRKVRAHGGEVTDIKKDCKKCGSGICKMVQQGNPELKCYREYMNNRK